LTTRNADPGIISGKMPDTRDHNFGNNLGSRVTEMKLDEMGGLGTKQTRPATQENTGARMMMRKQRNEAEGLQFENTEGTST